MLPARRLPVSHPAACLLGACLIAGCGSEPKINFTSVSEPPTVRLTQALPRTIVREVGQPSFVDSYEQTSIYPKMTAYVDRWIVDIGDRVAKGDVLATLFVPELVEEFRTKQADVALAKEMIVQAQKMLEVANADVKSAEARLAEAKSILGKYQSEADRWDTEVKRLTREVDRGIVSPQILVESTNQLKSSTASRDAAQATITAAQADLLSKQAADAKAKVDIDVARAKLVVAQSEAKRLEALVGYLSLTAPYDGVVVDRTVNTGDFVLPATGDPSAARRTRDVSSDSAAPLYVIDRIDVVRIYVDVPEEDADFVRVGTKASVLARAYRDEEMPAQVTRTSWALNVKSRTLRVEIDLDNPDGRLLPGMYAYGKVIIERPGVRALPLEALVYNGDRTFIWLHEKGKAVREEIQTGVSDGDWIEVTNHRPPPPDSGPKRSVAWTPFNGSEEVILGDLSILTEGASVQVAKPEPKAQVARRGPEASSTPADAKR